MAISRRTFNNILIYVCLAMLVTFQLPQMLAERRAREAGEQPEALTLLLFSTPIVRIEGQGWLLEQQDGHWSAQPAELDGGRLGGHWQQLKLLPLVVDAGEAARALANAPTVVLIWLQDASQPVTVRLVTLGDQLLVDAGGRLGQLPRAAQSSLLPAVNGG
ncbi:MAG: hypothetical protein II007_10930 [Gammaproteobacteria bacterium]|nr:hypothetical protein [Gammaproteobacteria bacterium]